MSRSMLIKILLIVLLAGGAYAWLSWRDRDATPSARVFSTPIHAPINEIVAVPVFIDTQSVAINAAELYLTFDPTQLTIESIDPTGSFFALWIKDNPSFSNDTGTISLAGGLPTPGHTGKGLVATLNVRLLKPGNHRMNFTDQSRILINDGVGTAQPIRVEPIKIRGQ